MADARLLLLLGNKNLSSWSLRPWLLLRHAGIAFDEDVLLEMFLRHGLRRLNPAQYGHWSGRDLPSFQDICIFEKG